MRNERKNKKFDLTNIKKFLHLLGNPQDSLRIIHIAGTNGKGSVSAMISYGLTEAGKRVGLFTSPHLIKVNERIQINNQPISDADLDGIAYSVLKLQEIHNITLTFFETITAIAYLYFKREKVDYAVMEAGMGGRLDATNVVTPLVSIITNISKEHEYYLGSSLLKIAHEKAGIIKKKNILITGATQSRVLSLFKERCHTMGTRYYQLGKNLTYKMANQNHIDYYG